MFFKKKQKEEQVVPENKQFSLQEVSTLLTSGIKGNDSNSDGIPDYLQRPEIASIIKSNKDLNQWEADTTEEIERFVMGLRGYELDPTTLIYKPESPPVLNEIGIRKIKTHLQTVVNKHTINTNIKEEDVDKLAYIGARGLSKWFKYNRKKCDISFSDMDTVIDEFDMLVTIVLKRAVNGGNREAVTARTKITNTGNNGSPGMTG